MTIENEFISIIGKANWDELTQKVLNKYNIPIIEPNSENIIFTRSSGGFVNLYFDDNCKTEIQKSMKEQGNMYLNGVVFEYLNEVSKEGVPVPFGININTSYEELASKIGHAQFQNPRIHFKKVWRLKREDGEIYSLACRFSKDLKQCNLINVSPVDTERKSENVKNELIDQNIKG